MNKSLKYLGYVHMVCGIYMSRLLGVTYPICRSSSRYPPVCLGGAST